MGRTVRVLDRNKIRARKLVHEGWALEAVGAECGMAMRHVSHVVIKNGGMPCRRVIDRQRHLSMVDREDISRGIAAGRSLSGIARIIGRDKSTVTREVNRNGGRASYRAVDAQHQADDNCRRPKQFWYQAHPEVWAQVVGMLRLKWSPEQIVARLELGPLTLVTVTAETIYKSIYVQPKGELRRELASYLRTNRQSRKPRARAQKAAATKSSIKGLVHISERNKEADDRAVPGHWEGDLILGRQGGSQVGTLVERTTRYLHLFKLDSKKAEHVAARMGEETVRVLKILAMKSIAWDQGTEMGEHAAFTAATSIPVYFCDPRSPWQRGSNENTNGLVRQYLPKGMDLSTVSQDQLDDIANEMNGRPRKTLKFMTPLETIEHLVATTA